ARARARGRGDRLDGRGGTGGGALLLDVDHRLRNAAVFIESRAAQLRLVCHGRRGDDDYYCARASPCPAAAGSTARIRRDPALKTWCTPSFNTKYRGAPSLCEVVSTTA